MSDQLNDQLIETSQRFWDAMEHADEAGMRAVADPECTFVHIGITAPLDQEIGFYTSGAFQPTSIVFHSQTPSVFGDTGVVITDCDYALLLDGKETTHHFAVTEVFNRVDDAWKLVTFSFTALVY
ncbi:MULTISPECIES: nuclear transport factor 2 family protein [Collinsella]|uniref:nuclear transport factor 2 family protein n=1 Tax=Collinsella TaxID=102106 RepID=UPI001302B422|nr:MULTISPECIES: nuclear transport factor 2 family protein [Collinsella]MBM6942949.1 nuclear transport factor 2 family protein [Collinsella intestinalis]